MQISNFYLNFFGKIQDFAKKAISWIFNSIALNLFFTYSFIWGISYHNLKYLDKPIKCLEMRAKWKSVRKINEIFLCIFTYIWKLDIFSTYPNFDETWFFGYFKTQISKLQSIRKILHHVLTTPLTTPEVSSKPLYMGRDVIMICSKEEYIV